MDAPATKRSSVPLKPCEASRHMRCGECLHWAGRVVSLEAGRCPRCGADYSKTPTLATRGKERQSESPWWLAIGIKPSEVGSR